MFDCRFSELPPPASTHAPAPTFSFSFVCLAPNAAGRMRGVLAAALAVAAAVFTTLCVGAAAAFGPALQVNVLSNLSIDAMAPLLGARGAAAASLAVQVGYCISLMASLLLYFHPLRTALAEIIWQRPASGGGSGDSGSGGSSGPAAAANGGGNGTAAAAAAQDGSGGAAAAEAAGAGSSSGSSARVAAMEATHYYALTYSLLAAATLAAASVPSAPTGFKRGACVFALPCPTQTLTCPKLQS
jgi:hypothetical protein